MSTRADGDLEGDLDVASLALAPFVNNNLGTSSAGCGCAVKPSQAGSCGDQLRNFTKKGIQLTDWPETLGIKCNSLEDTSSPAPKKVLFDIETINTAT